MRKYFEMAICVGPEISKELDLADHGLEVRLPELVGDNKQRKLVGVPRFQSLDREHTTIEM